MGKKLIIGLGIIGFIMLLMGNSIQAEVKDILFKDDFSQYSEGSSGSPTWEILSGDWTIEEGELSVELSNNNSIIVAGNPEWKDYILEARVKMIDKQVSGGVLFRFTDDYNFYYFGRSDAAAWVFYKVVNQVGSGTYHRVAAEANRWYNLKVWIKGEKIRCYLDNVLIFDFEDSSLIGGKVGFSTLGFDAHVQFDEVVVKPISAGAIREPTTKSLLHEARESLLKEKEVALIAGEEIKIRLLDKGNIILSPKDSNNTLVIYRPLIRGIWKTFNSETEMLKLTSWKRAKKGSDTDILLNFDSRLYNTKVEVKLTANNKYGWIRYQYEFINNDNNKKSLKVTIATEMYPLDNNKAELWFNPYTKQGPHPNKDWSAGYGSCPELAYGGTKDIIGWYASPPILGFYDKDNKIGSFIINSPYHAWLQSIYKDAKTCSTTRVIGLAPQKGYSSKNDTIFADGVYPLETIYGFYNGDWKKIIKKYYQAYPEQDFENDGLIKWGTAGCLYDKDAEGQAKFCAEAGFGLFNIFSQWRYYDSEDRKLRPIDNINIFQKYAEKIVFYTTLTHIEYHFDMFPLPYPLPPAPAGATRIPLDPAYEKYRDSFIKDYKGEIVYYGDRGRWCNPDPSLSFHKRLVEYIKDKYQKYPQLDGLAVDDVDFYPVDYGHPDSSGAYDFLPFDKPCLKAVISYKNIDKNKLLLVQSRVGAHKEVKYFNAGHADYGDVCWDTHHSLPIKIMYGSKTFISLNYPNYYLQAGLAKNEQEAVDQCASALDKCSLLWGFSVGSDMRPFYEQYKKGNLKPTLDFSRNIPVATKTNSLRLIWDSDAAESSHNLYHNVFKDKENKLFAITIKNEGSSALTDSIGINKEMLGIEDNKRYVMGVWEYEYANSKFILKKFNNQLWTWGRNIKDINVRINPDSVSILWIAEYDGITPVNTGFGIINPQERYYTEYVTTRIDDAKIEKNKVILPRQKVLRILKFIFISETGEEKGTETTSEGGTIDLGELRGKAS